MRHRKKTIKLGRVSAHRTALLSGMVCSLIESKRVKTTLVKAKATRSLAEKMVTLGKRGTVTARRQALAKLRQRSAVKELFESIAPAFAERSGGYTRIMKLGRRGSDSSEMAILEWVDVAAAPPARKEKTCSFPLFPSLWRWAWPTTAPAAPLRPPWVRS